MKRSYTVVYSTSCLGDSGATNCVFKLQYPLASLYPSYTDKQFPMFNVTEEITIDHDMLLESVDYIASDRKQIYSLTLALTLTTFILILLVCCFQLVYWMNTPVEEKVDERLLKL